MPSDFDTVITSRRGWFDLNLRELWRYRDLILMFVKRNFIAQYKQTVLGPAWAIIQPLLTTVVFTVVFGGLLFNRVEKIFMDTV
jgi:lipopolysaccharide transport system permease protein